MRNFIVLTVVSLSICGCVSSSSTVNDHDDQMMKMFGTHGQMEAWKEFDAALKEYNKERLKRDQIDCEPRKRDNGKFTYIHCEFNDELIHWDSSSRGLQKLQRGL